jgi:hypothetical protein
MSDVSVTITNLEDLLTGKTDFNGFASGEIALFKKDVAKLPATAQAFVNASVSSLETGASALVGWGQSAIGPVLAESTDEQSTLVLNLLQKLGVPTEGVLGVGEHALLSAAITGLKAGLDRIGIQIATNGTVTVQDDKAADPPAEQPAPAPQPQVETES